MNILHERSRRPVNVVYLYMYIGTCVTTYMYKVVNVMLF